MSRSAWRIWRISCPRRWASDLAWAGSLYPCSSRRGKMSVCFSSRASGVMSQGPVLLECQGVGASPCRSRPAARCDWSALRSCVKELAVMGLFGPSVSLKWSLACVSVEMIDATPPTSALLKLNVSRIVHRSVMSATISVCGSWCGSFPFFWTIGTARRYKDCHIFLISVLKLCCQWLSGTCKS